MFEPKESPIEWAKDRGFARHCSKHHLDFDVHIGCKKCREERQKHLFDNVIWPDSKK